MNFDRKPHHDYKIIAQKIWYARQIQLLADQKHMSLAELSFMSGVGEETLNRILNGEILPSKTNLKCISCALEVPADNLQVPEDL